MSEKKMEEKHITKTLANCKPREFFAQSNKVRKLAEKWLGDTRILEIRRKKPDFKENATDDERMDAIQAQAAKNLALMLEALLDKYPDETLDLMAMVCFIDPKDVDEYPMNEYFDAVAGVINNPSVIRFFTSLAVWGQRRI